MITSGNVTVLVSDLARSVGFYTETLGLELKVRYGENYAEVAVEGLTVALHPPVKDGASHGGSQSLSVGFAVPDLRAAVEELKEKGVSFSRIAEDGFVKLAFFSDPDGNPLYLAETKRW
ncbi:MAG: VOC family protein [Thaumarchaeota archaeon]|nr:VOC family protein [Nitrososphaerota archaeon]